MKKNRLSLYTFLTKNILFFKINQHIPLIDKHPRRDSALKAELRAENKRYRIVGHQTAEKNRYKERSIVERVNARLKDEFGGRVVRVRRHAKVMCHLMFGILALPSNQMMCFLE